MTEYSRTVAAAGEDAVVAVIAEELAAQDSAHPARRPGSADGESAPTVLLGIGDDAAVLDFNGPAGTAPAVVMSTDTMSQDQDFRLRWWADSDACGFDIGIKAAAQNLSDLNAMGAVPAVLLVSLSLPGATTLEWVRQFYRGLTHAGEQPGGANVRIIGGDLGASDKISVSITAVGTIPAGHAALRRDGAGAGDQVALAGTLGRAAAGLAYLEASSSGERMAQLKEAALPRELLEQCRAAQLRPAPPLRSGSTAVRGGATAGLDISDGLRRDAARLERASGVRIIFDEDQLDLWAQDLAPLAQALEDPQRHGHWVRAGGEDYALLATFPADAVLPQGFTRVGTVVAVGQDSVEDGGQGSVEDGAQRGAPRSGKGSDPAEEQNQGWDSWRR